MISLEAILFEGERILSLPPESGNLHQGTNFLVILEFSQLSEPEVSILRQKAAPVSERSQAPLEQVRQTVLAVCDGRYLGLRVLANLLNRRDEKDLRTRILKPLLVEGALLPAYPKANDPRQAYMTNAEALKEQQQ